MIANDFQWLPMTTNDHSLATFWLPSDYILTTFWLHSDDIMTISDWGTMEGGIDHHEILI